MTQQVLIVLGFRNDGAGRIPAMGVARIVGAVRVYRANPQFQIIPTGGYGKFNATDKPHAYYVKQLLLKLGVAEDCIRGLVESSNTVEDAILSKRLLAGCALDAVHVVTSDVHLARARWIFEHFFAPNILQFTGTPDRIRGEALQLIRAHEREALDKLHAQGGIFVDGVLLTR